MQLAIQTYMDLLKINPSFVDIYNNLGILYKEQGKIKEAEDYFKKAISKDKNNVQAYNNLGALYQDKGKSEEAIKNYKKSLSINPNFAEGYYNLGTLYFKLKKYDLSWENARKAQNLGVKSNILIEALKKVTEETK
ncbi:MAG: hypothetical protein ACD_12C00475G0001 [uncultured bacterium]|nr:MAG: hypothetical protein ACD_12C00475G0001 [uncultured bacterium]